MKRTSNKKIPFTRFMDMHSGGGLKEKWSRIYIQAPEEEACIIFYNRFGHNPNRVTCTCCGEDYFVSESVDLEQATGFDRRCKYQNGKYIEQQSEYCCSEYQKLSDYLKSKDVLVIYDKDIKLKERIGEVPKQGYVWID